MSKPSQPDQGHPTEQTTPRDAQKGGQGAIDEKHPERQLDQSRKADGRGDVRGKETGGVRKK